MRCPYANAHRSSVDSVQAVPKNSKPTGRLSEGEWTPSGTWARSYKRHTVSVNDASEVPALAEPFFLTFNAEVEFRIAMTPDDLGQAGLDAIGKKW